MSDETAINEITVSFSPHDRYEIAHYHALITEAARLAAIYHKRFGDYLNAEAAWLEHEHPEICEKQN